MNLRNSTTIKSSVILAIVILTFSIIHLINVYTKSGDTFIFGRTSKNIQNTPSDLSRPYPRARWRLASEKLDRVFLTISHILILHNESLIDDSVLRGPGWIPDAPSSRSRSEALQLAENIASKAMKSPHNFSSLAAKYSEDEVTRHLGGSLGTVGAKYIPIPFLDAIDKLKPGEVSRVVSTLLGFHILKLRKTPPEMKISASRIAIGYRGTFPFALRKNRNIDRSRKDAKEIANRLYIEVKKNPSLFSRFVHEYSDFMDASRNGDIGVWSNHAPHYMGREIEIISRLAVGDISEPVDSRFGFQIFLRTEVTERPLYAMNEIVIFFDPTVNGKAKNSRSYASNLASELIAAISTDPSIFSELQLKYCCPVKRQWSQGRGHAIIESELDKLDIGEITNTPIETADKFHIIERIEPTTQSAEEKQASFILPNPKSANIERLLYFVYNTKIVANFVRNTIKESATELGLTGSRRSHFTELLDRLARDIENADKDELIGLRKKAQMDLKILLGPTLFQRYQEFVNRAVETKMMSIPDPPT